MKICIFTNHFYPEDFKVNDIAFELQKKGFEISVITAVPDYPQGKYYKGYGIFKRNNEVVNNCKVYRLPVIPRGNGNAIQLVLNYASYFISASIFTFFHKLFFKYDAVFVHLTSPFFIGTCAVQLKKWQKIPLVFWTLDLWPESLTAAAGIHNSFILRSQINMVKKVYDNCDKILIGSKGFEQSICEKGNYHDKLVYFPNWAETTNQNIDFRDYQSIEPFSLFSEDDFVILFAGNIGESQNLDCLLDAAEELKSFNHIKFVLLGDGRARARLQKKVNEKKLGNTVFFPGRFPLKMMPFFMNKADVLYVSLKDELIFRLTVPSKVQFYMSQAKPILALLNGDGANLINETACGIAVSNSTDLVSAIKKFLNKPKSELKEMGLRGKTYYEKNFTKNDRIEQLATLLLTITHDH